MRLKPNLIVALLFCCATPAFLQTIVPYKIPVAVQASFRALSVVNNQTAWVAGSNGWVGLTTNGTDWNFQQLKAHEHSDFRSLYAFSATKALVVNAGSPLHVLLTQDGGKTWQPVYTNSHSNAFADGIDFWNEREGIIYGDPLTDKLFLLKTSDGGQTWQPLEGPTLNPGEASFAASGTGIRCLGKTDLLISTGGKTSRLFLSKDKGNTWKTMEPPVIQQSESAGIFSFDRNKKTWVVVGGDFTQSQATNQNAFVSFDDGKSWTPPHTAPAGYRECVLFLDKKKLITTGPSGTEISINRGIDWQPLSPTGYHVVRKARTGSLLVLAGNQTLAFVKP
ncbi:MAG: hypothetical protein J0L66_01580 [Cytophagales bacterium]|nr:hypothetical protein [Cytophagales bacterium]